MNMSSRFHNAGRHEQTVRTIAFTASLSLLAASWSFAQPAAGAVVEQKIQKSVISAQVSSRSAPRPIPDVLTVVSRQSAIQNDLTWAEQEPG